MPWHDRVRRLTGTVWRCPRPSKSAQLSKHFGPVPCRRRPELRGGRGPGHRLPRAQRLRQDHHAADPARPGVRQRRGAPPSAGAATSTSTTPSTTSAPCSRPPASIPSRRAEDHLKTVAIGAGIPLSESTRRSTWSAWPTWPGAGWASSPSACANACSWPPPCSATPRSSSSTSRPTGSIPRASSGCGRSSATRLRSGTRCWSPPTSSPRWRRPSTTWSSCRTGGWSSRPPWPSWPAQAGTRTGLRIRSPELPGSSRCSRPSRSAYRQLAPGHHRHRRRHPRMVRPVGRPAPDRPLRAGPRAGQPGRGLPQPHPRLRRRRSPTAGSQPAAASRAGPGPPCPGAGMIAGIRSEWLKMRTTAVPWVLAGIALVINALLILVYFLDHGDNGGGATTEAAVGRSAPPDSTSPHHAAAPQPRRGPGSPATCSPCCSACSS